VLVTAQGTFSDAPASVTIPPGHFDTTPSADMVGVSATLQQDHIFEDGWWYRVQGDAAETAFPAPDGQDYTGNAATITWNNVNGRGFAAALDLAILNDGNRGSLYQSLVITNNNQAVLTIDIFHCTDLDLRGTAEGDSAATQETNTLFRITDSGQYADYIGGDTYIVRPFGDPTDVPGLLSDGNVTNFDNSGLPFGPGDVTFGSQWATAAIAPGAQSFYNVVLGVNQGALKDFIRGDCNADGVNNIADAIAILGYLFGGMLLTPVCFDACNANDDAGFDVADAVSLLNSLFGSPAIPLPPPVNFCWVEALGGPNARPDGFDCYSFPPCN
jgi:hypothetical protein